RRAARSRPFGPSPGRRVRHAPGRTDPRGRRTTTPGVRSPTARPSRSSHGGRAHAPRCPSRDRSGNRSSNPRGRRPRRRFRASWFAQGPRSTYNVYETVGESIERFSSAVTDPRPTILSRPAPYGEGGNLVNPNRPRIVAVDPARPAAPASVLKV